MVYKIEAKLYKDGKLVDDWTSPEYEERFRISIKLAWEKFTGEPSKLKTFSDSSKQKVKDQ